MSSTAMPPRRIVGTATATTAIGAGVGAALAQLLVHWVPSEAEVEGAWTVILSALLGLAAGYLSPPQQRDGRTEKASWHDSREERLAAKDAEHPAG